MAEPLLPAWSGPPNYAQSGTNAADVLMLVDEGQETVPRVIAASNSLGVSSGGMRLTYFKARKSETIAWVRTLSGGTAAAATPTLCRIGLYSVAANGNLTLIGATVNNTALWAAQNDDYTENLAVPVAVTVGSLYAVGILVVTGAATPTFVGATPGNGQMAANGEAVIAPRFAASLTGQTDLPASIASGSLAGSSGLYYAVLGKA